MNPATVCDLANALKRGEYPDPERHDLEDAVDHIVAEIKGAAGSAPSHDVRNAMRILRRHRHFDHMHSIGSAWHDSGTFDALIQQLLAQSMVELGAFEQADLLLDEAEQKAAAATGDLDLAALASDFQGLRGRIRKQKFVATGDWNFLKQAVDCYQAQLDAAPSYFLGINVLALRTRLDDFKLDQGRPPLATFAHEIDNWASNAYRKNPADPWPLATRSEAYLALDDIESRPEWCDKAELFLYRFLHHPETGPFETQSYLRQLRELWRGDPLDPSSCAGRLAMIIERHVMRTERKWSVSAQQVRRLEKHPEELEKNFSGEKAFTVADLRTMLSLTPNIGCVTNDKGVRMGTGFLMPGSVFGKPHELVFVTNAHVISDTVADALPPATARVTFEFEADTGVLPAQIQEVLFASEPGKLANVADAPGKLDVTVCLLTRVPKEAKGLTAARAIPLPSRRTKAFVVGHPLAGEMQFSLQDSVLIDVCPRERLMHYRTPTEPGSSGSPVFNQRWEVIALHHAGSQACPRFAGGGTHESNEGITLQSIRSACC